MALSFEKAFIIGAVIFYGLVGLYVWGFLMGDFGMRMVPSAWLHRSEMPRGSYDDDL
jgi:hypothetical protein